MVWRETRRRGRVHQQCHRILLELATVLQHFYLINVPFGLDVPSHGEIPRGLVTVYKSLGASRERQDYLHLTWSSLLRHGKPPLCHPGLRISHRNRKALCSITLPHGCLKAEAERVWRSYIMLYRQWQFGRESSRLRWSWLLLSSQERLRRSYPILQQGYLCQALQCRVSQKPGILLLWHVTIPTSHRRPQHSTGAQLKWPLSSVPARSGLLRLQKVQKVHQDNEDSTALQSVHDVRAWHFLPSGTGLLSITKVWKVNFPLLQMHWENAEWA